LYVLSVGLAWAFGRNRDAEGPRRESEQALLFLATANWLRHKAAELLSPRTAARAIKL
jgi:hypothetical protein